MSVSSSKRMVGRRRWRPSWPARPERTFHRRRVPFTKRPILRLVGQYNPFTLQREVSLQDKKSMFWLVGLAALLVLPIASGTERILVLFGIATAASFIDLGRTRDGLAQRLWGHDRQPRDGR